MNANTENDRQAVRMLVRLRDDFQGMRKRMDNRIGRKADGTSQNIEERPFRPEDYENFSSIADAARGQEKEIAKMLRKTLKRFPIYTEWLSGVKGVGEIAAGWIVGEFDIHKATTVSKMWQFCGLNPGMVVGKKRVENKDGTFSYVPTDKMVRGDRMTPGFVAPFNKRLRTALAGVLADGFIKAGIRYRDATEEEYADTDESCRRVAVRKDKETGEQSKVQQVLDATDGYARFYLEYKNRLANSEAITTETAKGGAAKEMAWADCKSGHRDRAAKRYMIKMFLKDLYVAWREVEGLPVRAPYQEEYLGHKHAS